MTTIDLQLLAMMACNGTVLTLLQAALLCKLQNLLCTANLSGVKSLLQGYDSSTCNTCGGCEDRPGAYLCVEECVGGLAAIADGQQVIVIREWARTQHQG